MRIISQDGTIDIPYERCVIQRFREKIYFLNKNLTCVEQLTDDIEIASYSTEAKAQKAMEMLRENYGRLCNVKVLASGSSKHMEESFSENELKKIIDEYQEMNFFRFPNNEDVEVQDEQ